MRPRPRPALLALILLLASTPGASLQPGAPPPPSSGPARWPEAINRESWVTSDDYPASAILQGAEGRTTVRLLVGADGRIVECSVVASSGHAALDEATCALLTARARFRPAQDWSGRPMPAPLVQSVDWRLPEPVPIPLLAGQVSVTAPVPRDGGPGCAKQASLPELMAVAEDLCMEVLAEAEAFGPEAPTVRLIAALASGDGPLRLPPRPTGYLLAAQEAHFDVAPDGAVRNCTETLGPLPDRGPFELCAFLIGDDEPYFEASAGGRAPRRGRMRVEIYLPSGAATI
jgi:TonB family protein